MGRSQRRLLRLVPLPLALALLGGCGPWTHGPGRSEAPEEAVVELLQDAAPAAEGGAIGLAGFADGSGGPGPGPAARPLEDALASALVRSGLPMAPMADSSIAGGSPEERVRAACGRAGVGRVLVGRLHPDSAWTYVRLSLVECGTGLLLGTACRRLASAALRPAAAGSAATQATADVDLYLLRRRDEGGFARLVPLEEGGTFLPGDRLQIRFRVSSELQVWAFLYSSAGERIELLPAGLVYPGRLQFGPGEEAWVAPQQSNQVYTLYFVAAPSLAEDPGELFDRLAQHVQRSEIERFTGLDLADREVAAYVGRHLPGGVEVTVRRGADGRVPGRPERFILADGTALESRPERLRAAPAVVRAVSFAVP